MSSDRFSRRLYQSILRLNPAPFRERFRNEMLEIFDATASEMGTGLLIADGISSVVKQWIAGDRIPQPATHAFQAVSVGQVSMAVCAQATVLAFVAVLGFFTLLQQSVPLPRPPKTFDVRRSPLDLPCERKLEASRRLQ